MQNIYKKERRILRRSFCCYMPVICGKCRKLPQTAECENRGYRLSQNPLHRRRMQANRRCRFRDSAVNRQRRCQAPKSLKRGCRVRGSGTDCSRTKNRRYCSHRKSCYRCCSRRKSSCYCRTRRSSCCCRSCRCGCGQGKN